MFVIIALVVIVVAVFVGFYYWARREELLSTGQPGQERRGTRRISLLTEAVGYVGAILLLAGVIAAIGQRWSSLGNWAHVGVFAGAGAFFLLVGMLVRRVPEPAIQRFAGVTWFLSVAGVAGAAAFATLDQHENATRYTALAAGLAAAAYSAVLWLVRRRALQNVALFASLLVTTVGAIIAIDESASSLAFTFALWALGLAWAGLGWRRYAEPVWVTMLLGVLLALFAPTLAVGEYGWLYAVAVLSATAVMAASVPLRNTPLLALGTLAMFDYVTSMVIRYFGESLGVPAALTITGVLIIGLAVLTARLMRATRASEPGKPGARAARPPGPALPPGPGQAGPGQAGPGQAGPGQAGPGQAGSGEPAHPVEAEEPGEKIPPATAHPGREGKPGSERASERSLPKAS